MKYDFFYPATHIEEAIRRGPTKALEEFALWYLYEKAGPTFQEPALSRLVVHAEPEHFLKPLIDDAARIMFNTSRFQKPLPPGTYEPKNCYGPNTSKTSTTTASTKSGMPPVR